MNEITINGRKVGSTHPVYIIAEMSANHNRDFDTARSLIDAAHEAGADAIKLQTYTAETMTLDCAQECFRVKGTIWDGRTLYDLYREASMPWQWQPKLKQHANSLGLDLFSTPFDTEAVSFLEETGVPAHKIASFELVDIPLLQCVAATGKPVIMSTGMATLDEISEAVQTLRSAGCTQLALLKCTSAYPAPPGEMNLRSLAHLAQQFGVPVGLSDHSMSTTVPVTAVALGASIIEKHFTLSRNKPGPDSSFSLEPREFRTMVDAVREAEQCLGAGQFSCTEAEQANRGFRRSLFVVKDMQAGEPFTEENVRSIRPGHGLHTRYLQEILGRRARHNIKRGTPLNWDLITPTSQQEPNHQQ